MGNALRFLYGECCSNTSTTNNSHHHHQQHAHSAPPTGRGVSALSNDLYHFETTSQVPEGLSKHVVSSKKAQSNWYKKLSEAWRQSKPPPKTPEDASRLIILTLKRHQKADVEGLLSFYGLPLPHSLVEHAVAPPVKHSPTVTPPVKHSPTVAPAAEHGLKFELQTLPVDAKAVADGDTVTVYVSTKEAREAACVPRDVQTAAVQRSKARAERNYTKADALHKQIIDAGYRVLPIQNEEILAKKYRIRLRGIDAPESSMPYGKEAKEELLKLVEGKCLRVLIFAEDRYGRCVGDIYANGVFVQEKMLKKGLVWHYTAYDKRPELEKWEKDARAKRVGLWAAKNPEMPWEYRKNRRQGQGK